MPRRVNKPAVAILTIVVMVMTILAGVLLVRAIPSKDPLPLARKAEQAIARDDYRLAVMLYQQAYGRSKEPKYYVLAANAARDGGESDVALKLWQQAVLKDPGCLEARQNSLAFWLEMLEMNDWRIGPEAANQIRADAEALLKSQPDDFVGLFARGIAYTNLPDQPQLAPEGVNDLQRAIELKPSDLRVQAVLRSYWITKGQTAEAEKFFQDRIARLPEDPCGYLMLGQIWLSQKKTDEAIEQLKRAVSLAKATPEAPSALAQAYILQRDFAAADELLAQVTRDHADFFPGYAQRIEMLMLADRAPEALAQAEEWLKRPPILRGYKANRNRTERLQMQVLAASAALTIATPDQGETRPKDDTLITKAEEYVKAVEKEAGQSSGFTERLWGRIHRLRGNIVEATKWLEKADKSFGGTDADVRLRLAELYQLQKEPGLTKQMLDSVIKMAPQFARAHYMAAVVAVQMGDVADALNKVDQAIALAPDNREALQLKATLLRATDRKAQASAIDEKIGAPTTVAEQLQRAYQRLTDKSPKEAEAIYRNILSSDPANVQALRMLLTLLLQDDRDQDARKVYDAALAAAPSSSEIRQMELMFARNLPREQQDQEMLKIIQAEPDEDARNTQLTMYYAMRQKFDEAQKIADQMEAKKPESDRVVSLQFGLALARQDWTRAQKYADIAGRKSMDGADGGFYRARLATARGDLQKAQEELNGSLLKYPSFSDGWVLLGSVCLRLNRIEEARKSLSKALELNPTKGEAYKGLAQIAAIQNDDTAFEENLTKAVQYLQEDSWVADQWMALRERKDPKGAIAIRQKLLESSPDDIDNTVRLALLYEGQEQYNQATELIEKAQRKLPKDPQLAWLVANYWQRRNDPAKAEKTLTDLAEAVDADQKANATLLLGRLYLVQRQIDKAEQAFLIAVKQSSDQPGPHLELASFYRGAGRIDDAVKAYRQAVAIPKKEPAVDSMVRQQLIEMLLQSRKIEEATSEIESFHAAFPDEAAYQLLRGTSLMLQGKTDEALGTLTAYLQRQPGSAPGHYHRGLLYMATNRLPQAIDDLAMAKQLSPNGFNFEHRIALAQAYEASGKPQEAITELNEILRGNPQAIPVARMLAGVYQRADRMADLEVLLRKYMDLAPQDWTWPQALGQMGEATGKHDIAVAGYAAAAKASQYAAEPVDNLLRLYIAAKRYDRVIEFVEKTMPEEARVRGAKARLAQAYFLQGNQEKGRALFGEAFAEASKDYASSVLVLRAAEAALGRTETTDLLKRRVEAEPDNLILRYMFVAVLAAQEQWDAADTVSTELLAMAKSDEEKALVLRQRGGLLYQAKKREAAAGAFEELLKVAPDDPEALNNVAYTLAEDLNRPQEALRYAKRAVELRPRDANVIDTLGWVYCLAGDLDNAVGTLVSALQIAPDNIAVRYHVAVAYKKQGKMDEARRELLHSQQLIEKTPQDPIAQMFQDRVKQELSSLSGAAGK